MQSLRGEDGEHDVQVLMVDDEEPLYTLLNRAISRAGYTTAYARDGIEGLVLAGKLKPAVIVLDLRMPQMDGHTFLRRLKSLALDSAVVVTSGTGEMDDVIDIMRHGAVDYLRKPWSPGQIREAIARAHEIQIARSAGRLDHSPTSTVETYPPPPAAAPVVRESMFAELLGRIGRGEIVLPSVPSIVAQLRAVVSRNDSTLELVAGLVARDQALVSRVIQLGSTVQYQPHQPLDLVSTIGRLGFQELHQLAETIWLQRCFQPEQPRFAAYLERIGRFGLARAIAMRALAVPAKVSAPTAYFAGLLADVGASFLLYLIAEKPDAPALPEDCLPFVREHSATVGAQLLSKWGYAADVVQCVRDAHGQRSPGYGASLMTLGTATAAALLDETPPVGALPSREETDRCARDLGLSPAQRDLRVSAARAELKAMLATRK